MKKKIVLLILTIAMAIQMFVVNDQVYAANSSEITYPLDSVIYAKENYIGIIEAVKQYSSNFRIERNQLDNIRLGKPFIIYKANENVQDEMYYYPVLDAQDNIVLLICIIGTTDGWRISATEELVQQLNNIEHFDSNYILYVTDDGIYAENKGNKIVLESSGECDNNSFDKYSYDLKKQIIVDSVDYFVKADINMVFNNNVEKAGYTPSFSMNSSESKQCKLFNEKGQGNYGLCWAATVATISNYRSGTNVTAKNVADQMGIGYNDGGTIAQAQQALKKQGLIYSNKNGDANNIMSWNGVKTNVSNKYPIYVHGKGTSSAHAVTVYGYTVAAGKCYVLLWNSALNGGSGGSQSTEFNVNGTVFSSSSKTYKWAYSVSKY